MYRISKLACYFHNNSTQDMAMNLIDADSLGRKVSLPYMYVCVSLFPSMYGSNTVRVTVAA